MVQIPDDLFESSASKNGIIPFVGAGVSMSVLNKENERVFPSWSELLLRGAAAVRDAGDDNNALIIESLVKEMQRPGSEEDPLAITDRIAKRIKGADWARFLKTQFEVDYKTLSEDSLRLPKLIWKVAGDFLITTNYDKILNWTSPDKENTENIDWDNYWELSKLLKGNQKNPKVWHFHGFIDNPENIILTSESYNKLYCAELHDQSPYLAALLALRNLFMSHTILFVGFSFSDPYVSRQLEMLGSIFRGQGEKNYGLFRSSEKEIIDGVIEKLQIKPIYFEDFGEPLLNAIEQIVDYRKKKIVYEVSPDAGLKQYVSPNSQPPEIPFNERWNASSAVRGIDILGPAYVLNKNYYFLDWNPAFELLFAKHLGLRLLISNATDFIEKFRNRNEVEERAKLIFPANKEGPLVDIEPIYFQSKSYGLIELRKIAVRINESTGNDDDKEPTWLVTLDIIGAEYKAKLLSDLKKVIESCVNWSLYANNYDKLVCGFPPYQKLLDKVCSMLHGITHCVDLGAGTGNGALRLLDLDPNRFVCGIEPNEEMLLRFKQKMKKFDGQVKYIKQNIESLYDVPSAQYGGAIMINSLYAVDKPALALKETARILEPGAILALSTPHKDTNIYHLFKSIKDEYIRQRKFQEMEHIIQESLNRHEKMLHLIQRDSTLDIKNYLHDAGFKIDEWHDDQYEGSVVVIKASKTL